MKKNLLTIGLLSLIVPLNAQFISSVGDKALVTVSSDALVYNGGSLKTVGSGMLDVYGNVIISGDASNVLQTLTTTGGSKATGGNIVLRVNNADNTRYGQLAILGLPQTGITGIVDKEYRDNSHGTYQQIAMPFSGKLLSELSTELHKTFRDVRYSQDEILNWNNARVRSDNFLTTTRTSVPTFYYMLGAKGIARSGGSSGVSYLQNATTEVNPNRVDNSQILAYTPGAFIVKGSPYSDQSGMSATLTGAGAGENFGATGNNVNIYREKFNSYVQDLWDEASPWVGNFGKNMYQFGNPFLTNVDLSQISIAEAGGDGNNISNIVGVRFDPGTVTSATNGATTSTGARQITFASGVATGDVNAIIRPMQTFVVKLSSSVAPGDYNLNFNTLRRFKFTPRSASTYSGPNSTKSNSSVKQLGVIALDANGQELGRCYYVVYANGKTGKPTQVSTQVSNAKENAIGTFEEDPTNGGYDVNLADKYWLYINEANEIDFKGKAIPMVMYNDDIKSLKFEIRENAALIDDNQEVLSSGKSFYFNTRNQDLVPIKNGQIVAVNSDQYSLFYDKADAFLVNNNTNKPSRTKVTYSSDINDYVVVFDPNWKQADIKVYDASGKLILSKDKVSAKSDYVLNIQKTNGVYVVVATSERGEVVNTKIIR